MRGGVFNGSANPKVRAATTEITQHRLINLRICRRGILFQECSRRHDLSGLAIATLGNVMVAPRLLQRVLVSRIESLDRRNRSVPDRGNGRLAGTDGDAVQMNGTRATKTQAASIFGADKIEGIAQGPQKRSIGRDIDRAGLLVNFERIGRHGGKSLRGDANLGGADQAGVDTG